MTDLLTATQTLSNEATNALEPIQAKLTQQLAPEFEADAALFTKLAERVAAVNADVQAKRQRRSIGTKGGFAVDLLRQAAADMRSGKMSEGLLEEQIVELESFAKAIDAIADRGVGLTQRLNGG